MKWIKTSESLPPNDYKKTLIGKTKLGYTLAHYFDDDWREYYNRRLMLDEILEWMVIPEDDE